MKRWIKAVALTLGASAMFAAPAMADGRFDNNRRDDRHDDHRDYRHVEIRRPDYRPEYRHVEIRREPIRYVTPIRDNCDFDRPVNLCDVPARVLETARCESRGRQIEAVQFVSRDGKLFYRFRVDRRFGEDVNLRISPDGRLLSVQEVG